MTDKITNFVIEFDYNIEALQKIKEEMLSINKENIEEVEGAVKQLVKIRRSIETKGKTYRDEANAFNKMVISKEKEYVSIIEPLETEYKELIEQDKQRKIIEARKALLPMKKEQLQLLKVLQPSDEEILSFTDEQWVIFYQSKLDEHKKQIAYEEEMERKEMERKEREEQIKKEAEAKAEIEKAEALKRAEEEKIKAVENAKREAEEKAQKEKQEREEAERKEKEAEEARLKKEADEKAKLEADKKYQQFLNDNNFNEETDRLVEKDGVVRLYRLVAEFNK